MSKKWCMLVTVIFLGVFCVSDYAISKELTKEQRKAIYESILRGCSIFNSDEEFEKVFIKKRKEPLDDIYLFSYCNYIGKHLPTVYGDIKTAFPQKEWGIKKDKVFSYELFCQTTERLIEKISLNDLRKMMFIILYEGGKVDIPKSSSEKERKFLLSWKLSTGIDIFKESKKVEIFFLIKAEKEYHKNDPAKQERYKKLYASLMTGDGKEAHSIILSVPDKNLSDYKEGCQLIKDFYKEEFPQE